MVQQDCKKCTQYSRTPVLGTLSADFRFLSVHISQQAGEHLGS